MSQFRPQIPTGYIVGVAVLLLVALAIVLSSCAPTQRADAESVATVIPEPLAGGSSDRYAGTACEGFSYDACRGLGIDTLHEMSPTFTIMGESAIDDLAVDACDLMDSMGVAESVRALIAAGEPYEGIAEDIGYVTMYAATVECPMHYDEALAWSENPYDF